MEISNEEILEIKERKKREKDAKIYRRLMFLEMKHQKRANREIAILLDVTVETLSHWTTIYKKGGLELLCTLKYEGRRPGVLAEFSEEIQSYVKEKNVSTLKELQAWIKSEFNLSLGIAWIQRFCKKNSIYLTKKQG